MTNPPSPNEALRRDPRIVLIERIISSYHTTRLADVPAAVHILSKPWVQEAFAALSQPSPASSTEKEVRVLPGANSHVFDMRLVIGEGDAMERGDGGECIAFADEPWASRIAAALSPSSGEPAKRIEDGHADTEGEAAELWAHMNCPACGGSGHIDDVGEPASVAGEVEVLPSNLAEIIEAEMKAWKGANGGIYAIHACALGVSIALRSALSKPTPVEDGLDAVLASVPKEYCVRLMQTSDGDRADNTSVEIPPLWTAALIRHDMTGYANRKRQGRAWFHGGGDTPSEAILAALSETLPVEREV